MIQMTMRTSFLFAMMAIVPAYLTAQGLTGPNVMFQQAGALTGGILGQGPVFISSSPLGPAVTGKPFSGTEQRHSLQVLGDGTRIEHTDTNQYYRDGEGRTRVEMKAGENTMITISDPVAGFNVTLNPAEKTAHKMPFPAGFAAKAKMMAAGGPAGFAVADVAAPVILNEQRIEVRSGVAVGAIAGGPNVTIMRSESGSGTAPSSEDLGMQAINGVSAQGSRITLTIPAGQIGNDRQLSVVNERWFSSDLQMTVKSVNNDPRFGETTYELTNITQGAQDPTLFAIPSDYVISQPQTVEYKGTALR